MSNPDKKLIVCECWNDGRDLCKYCSGIQIPIIHKFQMSALQFKIFHTEALNPVVKIKPIKKKKEPHEKHEIINETIEQFYAKLPGIMRDELAKAGRKIDITANTYKQFFKCDECGFRTVYLDVYEKHMKQDMHMYMGSRWTKPRRPVVKQIKGTWMEKVRESCTSLRMITKAAAEDTERLDKGNWSKEVRDLLWRRLLMYEDQIHRIKTYLQDMESKYGMKTCLDQTN